MSERTELKPCPFCGGKAKVKENHIYTEAGLCVHCPECNVHTMTTLYDCTYQYYHGQRDMFITREMAEKASVDLWNRRVGDEQHTN